MLRVPVISKRGLGLMPTKASRARRWIKEGKAVKKWSSSGLFYIQLTFEPKQTNKQPIVAGVDPGKFFSGIAVQSKQATLLMFHLVLPFPKIRERMEQRRMMRRTRRSRRINRKLPYKLRNHRQCRFDNRKQSKLPPSIRANKELELRIVKEIRKIIPMCEVIVETIKARGDKGCSPVMVGQKWFLKQLRTLWKLPAIQFKISTMEGWETSNLRKHLGLHKNKGDKSKQAPETHAVDGVALAASHWISYGVKGRDCMGWKGKINITPAPFIIVKRPPISRRQLHLLQFSKGGNRRKYGGTVTRHGFRKGDLINTPKGIGYVSGDTKTQVSVSDANWKRLGQIACSKVELIQRSTGLIVKPSFASLRDGVSDPI